MPKESTIQRNIIQFLQKQGAAVFNVAGGPMQKKGTPDLLVCYKGHFLALEVKQPGQVCSKLQVRELDRVDNAQGVAAAVSSKEEVAHLIKDLPGVSWRKRRIATRPELTDSRRVKGILPQQKTKKRSMGKSERSKRDSKQLAFERF